MAESVSFEILSMLAEAIERQLAVAVIGAGVSAGGRFHGTPPRPIDGGVPTARQLVEILSFRKTYIAKSMTLGEAATLIKQREGRSALTSILQEELNLPGATPRECHHILARLPFAAYVSYNFDTLMEKALQDAGRFPHPIIEDADVSMARPGTVPVIKPHGCLSRPKTIKVATDETVPTVENSSLLFDMMKVTMAQKKLLYLGFSLKDADFVALHRSVVQSLGDYAPSAFAVVLEADESEIVYWQEQNISIIQSDAAEFLRRLSAIRDFDREEAQFDGSALMATDPWLQDAFFQKLIAIRSLPTETQVIDALIEHIEDEIEEGRIADLDKRTREAVGLVNQYRSNYKALDKVRAQLSDLFAKSRDLCDLQYAIKDLREFRRSMGEQIARNAARSIKECDRIFVYSQSKRVVSALRAVNKSIQATCTLYISEVRPKSPIGFQDAFATYDSLKDTSYELRLVPDMAFGHLVDRARVNKVLMGVHQLTRIEGKVRYFVNTAGSLMISRVCGLYKIPLILIAEEDKIVDLPDDKALASITFSPEENLTRAVTTELQRYRTIAAGIRIENYGYDLVPIEPHIEIVTERIGSSTRA